MAARLRPVGPGDDDLLLAIFASTRERELAMFPPETGDTFIRKQFDLQRRHLVAAYPDAADDLILDEDDAPVGRLVVATTAADVYLAEIAILAGARGRGLGRAAIESVQARAAALALPLRLHVEHDRPALRLYERVGFVTVAEDALRREMRWLPPDVDPAEDGPLGAS